MAHQASRLTEPPQAGTGNANRTGNVRNGVGPIQGVTEGASSVLGDAFDLAELQTRLLVQDSKEFVTTAKLAVLGIVIAIGLLIASLPVVALGFAQLLAWAFDWPLWIGQLGVGFVFVAIGVATAIWCLRRLRSAFLAFDSTQREAAANVRWLRQAFSKTFPL